MITAPSAASRAATALFPAPMPPVSPPSSSRHHITATACVAAAAPEKGADTGKVTSRRVVAKSGNCRDTSVPGILPGGEHNGANMTQGRHCIGRPGLGRRDITMILAAMDVTERSHGTAAGVPCAGRRPRPPGSSPPPRCSRCSRSAAGTPPPAPPPSCRCWPVDQAGTQRLSHQPWREARVSAILPASAPVPCASARTAPTPGPEGHAAWSRDTPHERIPPTEPSHEQVNGVATAARQPSWLDVVFAARRWIPAGRRRRTRSSPARPNPNPQTQQPQYQQPQNQQTPPNPAAQNAGQNTAQGAAAYTTEPVRHETSEEADAVPGGCAAAAAADRGTGHRPDRAARRGRRRCPGDPRTPAAATEQPAGETPRRHRTGGGRDHRTGPPAGPPAGRRPRPGRAAAPSLDASGSPVPGLSGSPGPERRGDQPGAGRARSPTCCGPARSG